jgi:hypothetical protein
MLEADNPDECQPVVLHAGVTPPEAHGVDGEAAANTLPGSHLGQGGTDATVGFDRGPEVDGRHHEVPCWGASPGIAGLALWALPLVGPWPDDGWCRPNDPGCLRWRRLICLLVLLDAGWRDAKRFWCQVEGSCCRRSWAGTVATGPAAPATASSKPRQDPV